MEKSILGAACALLALAPRVAVADDAGVRQPTRSVLIWKNAWLQTGRSADAPRVRHSNFADAERSAHLRELWSFPVIGDAEAALVEIETPARDWRDPEGTRCYDAPYALQGLKVRLFVRRADLVPVTTGTMMARAVALPRDVRPQPKTLPINAGDRLTLHPGVGLVPYGASHPGLFVASHSDFTFAVEIDDEKGTSRSYEPSPIRYELHKVLAGFPNVSKPLFWVRGFEPRPSGRKDGRNVLLSIHEPCLDTELAVKKSQLLYPNREGFFEDVPGLGMAVLGTKKETPEEKRSSRVRDGATAYWPDGSAAGTVEHGRRLVQPASDSGARRCFRVSIIELNDHPAAEQALPLCFDPADLQGP
jgi:hypothetical protein